MFCSLADRYQLFGGNGSFHLQGKLSCSEDRRSSSCRKIIPTYQSVGHHVPEDHNLVTHSCEDLKFHKHTWCNATRFRCRSSMQHILNKDAISHVATDVEPETGEVMTPECYYIYLGLLTTWQTPQHFGILYRSVADKNMLLILYSRQHSGLSAKRIPGSTKNEVAEWWRKLPNESHNLYVS